MARVRRRDVNALQRKFLRAMGTASRRERIRDLRASGIPRGTRGIAGRNLWRRRRVVREADGELALRMSTQGVQSAYHGQVAARIAPAELAIDRAFEQPRPQAAFNELIDNLIAFEHAELSAALLAGGKALGGGLVTLAVKGIGRPQ